MVIFYDKASKNVHHAEDNVLIPTLPFVDETGLTDEQIITQKREILAQQNLDFVSLTQELGVGVLAMKVSFDINNNFIGLQPM